MFSFSIGLGQGSQPIESFNYGASRYNRVRKALLLALGTSFAISLVAFVFFQTMPRQILALFGNGSEEYFAFGENFFRIFLFFVPLVSLQPVISTFFTSIGKPIKGIIISLTRQILFFLPLAVVLPMFMGIDGIVYAGPVSDLVSTGIAIAMTIAEFGVMHRLEREKAAASSEPAKASE